MEIVQLLIVGAVVSFVIEGIKRLFGANTALSYVIVIVISFAGGLTYWFLKDNAHFWASFTQVLIYANAVYVFLLAKLLPPKESTNGF